MMNTVALVLFTYSCSALKSRLLLADAISESNRDTCDTDSDCEIKNVGNCCGYYPLCVNTNYVADPDAVQQQCEKDGVVSVCGFTQPTSCICQSNRCQGVYEVITIPTTTTTTTQDCTLPDGYSLVATPDQCPLVMFLCVIDQEYFINDCGCGCKPVEDLLQKKQCRNARDCDDGFQCIRDPQCTTNYVEYKQKRKQGKICIKKTGHCGGFVGAPCESESDECVYACDGGSEGTCVVYQYE